MNPMNWFLLFNLFNVVFLIVGAKLSFLYKEFMWEMGEKKEISIGSFVFNF